MSVPEALVEYPTAVQALESGHETADRTLEVAPVGVGTGSIDHVPPLSPSARALEPADPTAVHSLAAVHDTPLRVLPPALLGLGVLTRFQLDPFQPAANAEP